MGKGSNDSIRAKSTSEALRHLNRYLILLNARLDKWFADDDDGVLTSLTGSSKGASISRSIDEALAHLGDLTDCLKRNAVIPKLKSLKGTAMRNARRKK